MLRENPDMFTMLERKALLIAALCHDLDHLGYNNAFAKKFIPPFEKLYPASQMENYHIRETFRILSITGTDILFDWAENDKAEFAYHAKESILATDLALYFAGKKTIEGMIDAGLDLSNGDNRRRLMNLMMNASDLSAATKPWETQVESAQDLYDEFYSQGDLEKRFGEPPIPMQDRNNADNFAKEQVGFVKYVCLPMYTVLSKGLPSTQCLVDSCVVNYLHWEREVAKAEEEKTARLAAAVEIVEVPSPAEQNRSTTPVDRAESQMRKEKKGKAPKGGRSDLEVPGKGKHGRSRSPGKVGAKFRNAEADG